MPHLSAPIVLLSTALILPICSATRTVTLSNLKLPTSSTGGPIITGEASVLRVGRAYFFYFNDWGSCPGVNCCDSPGGCASCCFAHPPHPYLPGCGGASNGSNPYGLFHVVHGYRTLDFETWDDLGVVFRYRYGQGILFRPHVVYSGATQRFVMWFEDRSCEARHCGSYYTASSTQPEGPFGDVQPVKLPGDGSVGDFDVFVDDDGTGYHVRTGFDIVRLTSELTAPEALVAHGIKAPRASEAPILFRRLDTYYLLVGTGCCACLGGSNLYVFSSSAGVAGPWALLGDVGAAKPEAEWNPHRPDNFVTRAQGSAVFVVDGPTCEAANASFVFVGNAWNSGLTSAPPSARNHDLLYFAVLDFDETGRVRHLQRQEAATFEIGTCSR